MTEKLELVRGSGNVFRDLGHPRADVEQLKSILATEIIGVLDDRKLSVRKAESVTGINASEFSRIRNVQLGRFTVDRLMTILNHLNRRVDVRVTTRPYGAGEAAPVLGAE
ncbi:MAG: helix-turn-helix domain-containing protein [Pseudomonadota bacterium]|nr:helix-turn-helix domain-containing protein [Pseudomonadota bacterium]